MCMYFCGAFLIDVCSLQSDSCSNNKTISRPSYTKPHPACVIGEQAVRQIVGQGIPDMRLASKHWWNIAF